MAQKRVVFQSTFRMSPECHPEHPFHVIYIPERGGDKVNVKCSQCYRVFFEIKLPKEEQ